MCDYSLHSVKSRPARVGDKLTTRDFGTGTRGFSASENPSVAVCVLPGTELAFAHEVERLLTRLWPWHDGAIKHKTAIFRQINKEKIAAHHDALEFPDGRIVLLTFLLEGQQATVLQLPAESKTVGGPKLKDGQPTSADTSQEDSTRLIDRAREHDVVFKVVAPLVGCGHTRSDGDDNAGCYQNTRRRERA
jgi:hypothetical protein